MFMVLIGAPLWGISGSSATWGWAAIVFVVLFGTALAFAFT
ncbi:hypothetical protein N1I81_06000 [Bacillus sp. FSL M8-0052]